MTKVRDFFPSVVTDACLTIPGFSTGDDVFIKNGQEVSFISLVESGSEELILGEMVHEIQIRKLLLSVADQENGLQYEVIPTIGSLSLEFVTSDYNHRVKEWNCIFEPQKRKLKSGMTEFPLAISGWLNIETATGKIDLSFSDAGKAAGVEILGYQPLIVLVS